MKQSGLSRGIFIISEWIMRFAVVNLLWILFNLPIIYIVFNLLYLEENQDILLLIIILIPLFPSLLFPATMPMFAMVRDWVIERNVSSLFIRLYWNYYKENYKSSLFGGTILTVFWLIWGIDIYYLSTNDFHTIFIFIFMILGIMLYIFTINFFSINVHYHITISKSLRHAFLLTMTSPLLFISIALTNGFVIYISFSFFRYFLPFLTCSFIAFLSFSSFYRHYLKVVNKQEKMSE